MFGMTTREVRALPISGLVRNSRVCDVIREAMAAKRSGVLFDFNWPGDKPGQPRVMQGRTSLIETSNGLMIGMLLTIHDVTGEREVERLKSELLSTAAHELNTPLATIIGYSELILAGQMNALEEHRESLVYIHQKAWALSKLVDDLLDLSRIESRQWPVKLEPVPVEATARRAVESATTRSTELIGRLPSPAGRAPGSRGPEPRRSGRA